MSFTPVIWMRRRPPLNEGLTMPNREPASSRHRAVGAALSGTVAAMAAGAVWAAAPPPAEVVKPVWVQKPSLRDLMSVYPSSALDNGKTGMVVIGCRVAADGTLGACTVEKQPRGKYGFGEAGLKLASRFRMDARDADGRPTAGAGVRIPIQFKIPDDRAP
jgi:protein TonB